MRHYAGSSRARAAMVLVAAVVQVVATVAMISKATPAFAVPALQLPWPNGVGHAINGGFTYNCGTHTKAASKFAIDFQVGGPKTATNDAGATISAVAAGQAYKFPGTNGGYGNVVMIDHGGGIVSFYAHIKRDGFMGNFPRHVERNDDIAVAGGTGFTDTTYAVHLHLELREGVNTDLLSKGNASVVFSGTGIKPEPMSGYTNFGQWGLSADNGCTSKVANDPAHEGRNVPSPRLISSAPAAPPPTSTGQRDLVFVIDTTGSMFDDIDAVKRSASAIVNRLSGSFRVALVDYKDHPVAGGESSDYPSKVDLDFSADKAAIVAAINGLSARGGGDFPESVYSGIMRGLSLGWRSSASRSIIWMGDAPPKDPEPVTGFTFLQVVAAALSKGTVVLPGASTVAGSSAARLTASEAAPSATVADDFEFVNPVQIFSVEIGGNGGPVYRDIARETGGEYFNAADASQVVDALSSAIEAAIPLEPVAFSVSAQAASYQLHAEGRVTGETASGFISGQRAGEAIPVTQVTEAGLRTNSEGQTLIVRFLLGGQRWELRFPVSALGVLRSGQLCGPPGCEPASQVSGIVGSLASGLPALPELASAVGESGHDDDGVHTALPPGLAIGGATPSLTAPSVAPVEPMPTADAPSSTTTTSFARSATTTTTIRMSVTVPPEVQCLMDRTCVPDRPSTIRAR